MVLSYRRYLHWMAAVAELWRSFRLMFSDCNCYERRIVSLYRPCCVAIQMFRVHGFAGVVGISTDRVHVGNVSSGFAKFKRYL